LILMQACSSTLTGSWGKHDLSGNGATMALIPSREGILRLLDELDKGKVAADLESETLDFKPWLADTKENQAVAIEAAVCFANSERRSRRVRGERSHPRAKSGRLRMRGI